MCDAKARKVHPARRVKARDCPAAGPKFHGERDILLAEVETIYRHIAAVFKAAARERVISSSPCEGITLPKQERDDNVASLTVDQVQAVAQLLPERTRGAFGVSPAG